MIIIRFVITSIFSLSLFALPNTFASNDQECPIVTSVEVVNFDAHPIATNAPRPVDHTVKENAMFWGFMSGVVITAGAIVGIVTITRAMKNSSACDCNYFPSVFPTEAPTQIESLANVNHWKTTEANCNDLLATCVSACQNSDLDNLIADYAIPGIDTCNNFLAYLNFIKNYAYFMVNCPTAYTSLVKGLCAFTDQRNN